MPESHEGFDYRNIPEQALRNGRAYYHTMVRAIDDQLVRHRHGDSSGVRGAAWLFGAEEAG